MEKEEMDNTVAASEWKECWESLVNENMVLRQKYFDLRMLIKELLTHQRNGPEEDEEFWKYIAKSHAIRKRIRDFIGEDK
jgi:hypothetical protein